MTERDQETQERVADLIRPSMPAGRGRRLSDGQVRILALHAEGWPELDPIREGFREDSAGLDG